MKQLAVLVIFTLVIVINAFAESPLAELDKIKKIKLLESTREDVKKIFDDKDEDSDGDSYLTDNFYIEIAYSNGDCFDEDGDDDWNVPEDKVVEIGVVLRGSDIIKDLKIDLSKLEKIKKYKDSEDEEENPDDFVYYDRESGISYGLSDGKIKNIKFIPPEKNYPALCNNEDFRLFPSHKEWFIGRVMRRPYFSETVRSVANVTELVLSKNEIPALCVKDKLAKVCAEDAKIEITTQIENPDNDNLSYQYTVSGGKIIGNGANVTWDLTGVKPGEYTITAAVDNGCGFCGKTITQTVAVKDCPDCKGKVKK